MTRPNDIVGYIIENQVMCSGCVADNAIIPDAESEIARWDAEPSDVCIACCEPLHPDSAVYIIGNNMPGYLPDSEPYTVVGTFEDAKKALISDLWFEEENAIDEEDAEEYANAQQDVNLWSGPDNIHCGQYIYWISRQ